MTYNQTTLEDGPILRHDEEDSAVSIYVAKGVSMAVLFSVSLFMGLIPIYLAKRFHWTSDNVNPRATLVVRMLLGFGGGVLLSTTFVHLLPEVSEAVDTLIDNGTFPHLHISLAETFMCAGFFLMYLVEELVHTFLRREVSSMEKKRDLNKSTNDLVTNDEQGSRGTYHGHSHMPLPADDGESTLVSSIRGLLIVLGISVHELFEGLAIGLESSTNYVWYMLASVSAHKFVIAFCVGVELITSKTKPVLIIIYISVFSVITSAGIGIGMALVGTGNAATSGATAVVLQGMAAGTLMFVVFFEILHKNRDGLTQFAAILVGFLLMLGVQLLGSKAPRRGCDFSNNEHCQIFDGSRAKGISKLPISFVQLTFLCCILFGRY